ncbi:antiterminator Q family protein [Gallibacterium sp. ZY190522]
MHITDNIKLIAKRYGKWANEGNGLGYPSIEPFLREAKRKQYGIPMLDDETAMQINHYSLIMRSVTPELYQVFMLRFVSMRSINQICKEMSVSPTTCKSYLYAALQSLKLLLTSNCCIFIP